MKTKYNILSSNYDVSLNQSDFSISPLVFRLQISILTHFGSSNSTVLTQEFFLSGELMQNSGTFVKETWTLSWINLATWNTKSKMTTERYKILNQVSTRRFRTFRKAFQRHCSLFCSARLKSPKRKPASNQWVLVRADQTDMSAKLKVEAEKCQHVSSSKLN